MNTWEVLERAADNIERDGWFSIRGSEPGSINARCANNAISDVGIGYCEAHDALLQALTGNRRGTLKPIWEWNDAPERTKAEVVAMLRAVAATEKARAARLMPVVQTVAA